MKGSLLGVCTLFVIVSICSCQPRLVRNPFPPRPNIDSLDSANKVVGKHYYLIDSFANADFNYANIEQFDSLTLHTLNDSIKFLFAPLMGDFFVYQFIAEYNSVDYENRIRPFHDILIVKADKHKKIIDAFQYTLEWGEVPCSIDLYRLSKDTIYLTDNMELKKMEMVGIKAYQNNVELLMDEGIIHLSKH